jgi:hypothetical protein
MPTGYTYQVQSGKVTSEKDFILHCAEQFGALASKRDENFSIDKFRKYEPNSYYVDHLSQARLKLSEIAKMTYDNIKEKILSDYHQKVEDNKKYIKKVQEERKRYTIMLEKVESWVPPTKDHIELKKFAISQLQDSINHDCDLKYYNEANISKPDTSIDSINKYIEERIEDYKKDIKYYSKQIESERKKYTEVNKWVEDLLGSFSK